MDDARGVGLGKLGVAPLAAGVVARPHFPPLRRARLRAVGSRGPGVVARGLGARSGDGGRRGGHRALPAARALAGRGDRHRLCRAPPRAGQPPGSARRLCPRALAAQSLAAAARGRRDARQARRARLGQGRPGVPPVLHHAIHTRLHARAAALVERAAALDDFARERGAFHAGVQRGGCHGARAPGVLPDAGGALEVGGARSVRGRPGAGGLRARLCHRAEASDERYQKRRLRTVTEKLPLDALPAASLAVQLTVVVPTGNTLPEAGAQVTLGIVVKLSVADTV